MIKKTIKKININTNTDVNKNTINMSEKTINVNKDTINIPKKINMNYDYLAGLFHADGTFTVTIGKRKNDRLNFKPSMIFTQHEKSLDVIKEMKLKFQDIGSIQYQTNKICKYRITGIKNIKEYVLPIFDKYTVRSNRYSSYLKFKLIINILYFEKPTYNSSL